MTSTILTDDQPWREREKICLTVSPWRRLWDHLLAPLRISVLSEETSHQWGLSSIKDERVRAVFPYCQGRLLDIGCGRNNLVATYSPSFGVGVDIYDWKCGALILPDSSKLPFQDKSFDTIVFLACLNHIPNRDAVLLEARRVLTDSGRLLITMPTPAISKVAHKWWEMLKLGEDWVRDWHEDEVYGFNKAQIEALLSGAHLELIEHRRFLYGFNHLYVAAKRPNLR
jgi:SAM-dependent methyltransferase